LSVAYFSKQPLAYHSCTPLLKNSLVVLPAIFLAAVTPAGPLHLLCKQLTAKASSQLSLSLYPCNPQEPEEEPKEQQLPYHISLSRTVAIRREQIGPLKAALKQGLSKCRRAAIALKGLSTFANDEGSRTFVSLMVEQGCKEVIVFVSRTTR
jgi:hypothetical protein